MLLCHNLPIPDKLYLQILYFLHFFKRLNLKDPKTFSEKLQWLKLYNRKPEYTQMVDKYAVKEYVKNIIGEQYIIPTLGFWDTPQQIEWDKLPKQFVLKTTHGGGGSGVVICKDKDTFDRKAAIKKLQREMKKDIYRNWREYPYKDIPHRILAEKYMEDATSKDDLHDYKFYCFNGEVKMLYITSDRNTVSGLREDFFDCDTKKLLPFNQKGYFNNPKTPELPCNFEKMKQLASLLSVNIPQLRVDFYEVDGKIYFGELTFFCGSGFSLFSPKEWEYRIGSWIKLPTDKTL